MYRRIYIGLSVAAMALTGCATDKPHNEVLIFGTSTKLAADVGAPVHNAGIPEFTIGYKRQEAVWMPLKPNDIGAERASDILNICAATLRELGIIEASDIKDKCLQIALPAHKYVSFSSGVNSNTGGSGAEIDTYSVFASFGGSGNLSFNNASGNLAQFFATGIAAQRLGANPSVGVALNATAPEAEVKKAEAQAEQSQEFKALIDSGASLEEAAALTGRLPELRSVKMEQTDKAMTCIDNWAANGTQPAGLLARSQTRIASLGAGTDELREELSEYEVFRNDVIKNC